MNKSDLVLVVSQKLHNLKLRDVDAIVDTIFEAMTGSLAKGDRIEIRGFGSFEVRVRRPRVGRNPKTGASVKLKTRRVPFFKVGRELKELVNK